MEWSGKMTKVLSVACIVLALDAATLQSHHKHKGHHHTVGASITAKHVHATSQTPHRRHTPPHTHKKPQHVGLEEEDFTTPGGENQKSQSAKAGTSAGGTSAMLSWADDVKEHVNEPVTSPTKLFDPLAATNAPTQKPCTIMQAPTEDDKKMYGECLEEFANLNFEGMKREPQCNGKDPTEAFVTAFQNEMYTLSAGFKDGQSRNHLVISASSQTGMSCKIMLHIIRRAQLQVANQCQAKKCDQHIRPIEKVDPSIGQDENCPENVLKSQPGNPATDLYLMKRRANEIAEAFSDITDSGTVLVGENAKAAALTIVCHLIAKQGEVGFDNPMVYQQPATGDLDQKFLAKVREGDLMLEEDGGPLVTTLGLGRGLPMLESDIVILFRNHLNRANWHGDWAAVALKKLYNLPGMRHGGGDTPFPGAVGGLGPDFEVLSSFGTRAQYTGNNANTKEDFPGVMFVSELKEFLHPLRTYIDLDELPNLNINNPGVTEIKTEDLGVPDRLRGWSEGEGHNLMFRYGLNNDWFEHYVNVMFHKDTKRMIFLLNDAWFQSFWCNMEFLAVAQLLPPEWG